MTARLALLACLAFAPAAVHAEASGTLTEVQGQRWPLRDALAYRDGDYVLVILSSLPFDWMDFASDGKLDRRDIAHHRSSVGALGAIELRFDAKGYFRAWDGIDSEPGVNPVGGWKPGLFDAARISGRFDYASTDATFDLQIHGEALEPAGTPLTADAEPVRALIANFAARKKRDLDAVLAASLPPEQIPAVDAEQRAKFAGALAPGPLSIESIAFRSGRIAGDVAQVEYAAYATILDGDVRTARLDRIDGRWVLREEDMD